MKRQIEIEIDPMPEEMAECFADMDEQEQARFFNTLAELVAEWKNPACVQWLQMEKHMTREAIEMVANLGVFLNQEAGQ